MAPTVDAIDALLPQTQCTRCGYPDCRAYAQAIADGEAAINQCPPGGAEGIERLAALTGLPVQPLNPANGVEGPVRIAHIDEDWCIGCTLCIEACPVDCIAGAPKHMHTVIEALCTGCELCLPACPVDCIALEDSTPGRSGWDAWSAERAEVSRQRYQRRRAQRPAAPAAAPAEEDEAIVDASTFMAPSPPRDDEQERKRGIIAAVLARARATRR